MKTYTCVNDACPNKGIEFQWDNADKPHCNACNANLTVVGGTSAKQAAK